MWITVVALLGAWTAPTMAGATAVEIRGEWPSFSGVDGTRADPSRVPLLDDLSRARLAWVSEHEGLGYGKTSSGGGHIYGGHSNPSGSASLIVAGENVIAGYFTPRDELVADDVILAVDAATGQTRWKRVYEGKGFNHGAGKYPSYGPTPAAADGRVFHLGSSGRIYAVDLESGRPLWQSEIGDYREHYEAIIAAVRDGQERARHRAMHNALRVIDGVLMVAADRLYAFDVRDGRELWRLDGATRPPSPVELDGEVYALCSGADRTMRLVEPRSGRVLWSEPLGVDFPPLRELIVGDGRAFAPYSAEGGRPAAAPVAAFALSRDGARRLWVSQATMGGSDYAYRDGKLYLATDGRKLAVLDASNGAVVAEVPDSAPFFLWGDRIVVQVSNRTHESIGHVAHLRAMTGDADGMRPSGHVLTPRTFAHPDGYLKGVSGYIMWMRTASVDGFAFDRSVNATTGKGVIVCWDLRARPENVRRSFSAPGPWQGLSEAANQGRTLEVEFDRDQVVFIHMVTPARHPGGIGQWVVRGQPSRAGRVADGRWQGELTMDYGNDVETWQLEVETSGTAPTGTYRRVIPALPRIIDVQGNVHARKESLEGGGQRWFIHMPQAINRDPDASAEQRQELYIVVDRTADGEVTAWARAPRVNVSTHEVQVRDFEAGDTTLRCDAIVVMHADRYLSPSAQRVGTVAVEVSTTLRLDGERWQGSYRVRQGVAWSVEGELTPALEAAR